MKLNYPRTGLHLAGAALLACCALPARADYSSTVVSQAPEVYYRLDETAQPPLSVSATNLGSAGAAAYGSYSTDVQRGVPGAIAGDSNLAAGFSGGAYMRVPNVAALNPAGAYSVEFWAKPNSLGVFSCPVSSTDFSVNPRLGWLFYQDNNSVAVQDGWVFRGYNSAGSGQIATPAGTVTTNWQHVVAVVDPTGGTIKMYLNGQEAASAALTGTVTPNTAQPLSLGVRYDNGFAMDGSLDEVAIYPAVLSAARVLAHYQAGTNAAPTIAYKDVVLADSPAGYWRLSEIEGPPAANLGTLGAAGTGHYYYGVQTGQAGPSSPTYTGFEAANKGVGFAGTGGYVKIPALNVDTNTVTMTAWVKSAGPQSPNAGIVFNRAGNTVSGLTMDGNPATHGIGYTWNNDPATYNWWPASDVGLPTLQDGVWAFVALVVQPSQATMYIANSTDPNSFSSAVNPVVHAAQPFEGPTLIGADGGFTNRGFNGVIDEVSIFNRALGAGELYTEFGTAVGGVGAKIFTQPQAPADQVFVGDTLKLTVDAGGTAPLTYQWRKDGNNISGATDSVYTKVGIQLTDSGNYDVIVQAAAGSSVTSLPATVVINPLTAPVVNSGIEGRTLYPGGTLHLTVSASGGGLVYYWTKNGSPIAGATGSSYLVTSVSTNDGGSYNVTVSNAVSTASSGPATINVVSVVDGTFEAAVVRDRPEAWYRLDESSGTTMWDAMGRHDGTYNGFPTLGAPGLGGNAAVSFDGSPANYGSVPFSAALNGSDFTLECWVKTTTLGSTICPVSSRANSKGEWFWTYPSGKWSGGISQGGNDFYLPSDTPGSTILADQWTHLVISYGSTTNGSLRMYVNGQWDGAGYVDFDRNGSGPLIIGARGVSYNNSTGQSVVDEAFVGEVAEVAYYPAALSPQQILDHYQAALYGNNSKPVFKTQPVSQTVIVGDPAGFSAYVEGTLPISYQWTKDGAPIAGATTTALDIASAQFSDYGIYQLVASNSVGVSNSAPVTLNVAPVPSYANATNGLVLHMRFDGDYQDSSGHGNNGTAMGSPTIVAGKIGSGALHYNTDTTGGVYNYVSLGTPSDLLVGADTSFSVAYWVRLPSGSLSGDLPFLCSAVNSYSNDGMTFAPSYQAGGWSWSLGDSAGWAGLYGPDNSINDGNWHHLVHVFDRSTGIGTTYLDGVSVDNTSFAGVANIDTAGPFSIGQDPTGLYGESGSADLDDLGFWRRALTPLEAYGIYYAGQGGTTFDTYGPVSVHIDPSGSKLVISWQGGTLLSAPSLSGPWTPVSGATAPNYVVTPAAGNLFFRVQL